MPLFFFWMNKIFANKSLPGKNNKLLKLLKLAMPKDTATIIKESKTVGSEGKMSLEFGFNLRGKRGVYLLETNEEQITHERLAYRLKVNKRILFDCTQSEKVIHQGLFR